MVVLAASICTRGGRALISRQFRDVSKDRITTLLSNFPTLISQSDSQNTSVEDENVRYVYQPLEEFYIVMITNKNSNILQDIDTLHLFAASINDLLRMIDEREIFDNAFEIISAFDEIINLGYKENLTLTQVETFLEMESHEEKIQEIIEKNKEMEATEERRKRAKELQRKELARRNMEQFGVPTMRDRNEYDNYSNQYSSAQPTYEPSSNVSQSKLQNLPKPMAGRGGLQLGKKTGRTTSEQSQPLLASGQPQFMHPNVSAAREVSTSANASPTPTPQALKVPNNGILVTINEKVSAELTREGSVVQSEVKGDLQLRINKEDFANSKILLKTAGKSSSIQYKTHPNVDRNLFNSESIIGLKDESKSFPSNDQSLGVLRWRILGKDDDLSYLPIVFTSWVGIDGDVANVTLEYEVTSAFIESHPGFTTLEDIKIIVPISSDDVNLKDGAENVSFELSEYGVIFTLEAISLDEPQGSFEFSIPASDEDSLFPMEIQFNINKTEVTESDVCFGKVSVIDVVSNSTDEQSLPFDLHFNITSEAYQVN